MNTPPPLAKCSACGTSPIQHQAAFALNILDEIIGRLAVGTFGFVNALFGGTLMNVLERMLFGFLNLLGIVRFGTEIEKAVTGRSELIWREARRRGIPMEQLIVFGNNLDYYRARVHGRWYYFESLPVPPWIPQKGYHWVDDKFLLARRLEAARIPAPKAYVTTSWRSTLKAFSKLEKPVIIKPRIGSRGRHTTTNISTEAELRAAHALAREIARELVVEEHLFGSVYRATVIDGVLVGFFRGDPPNITGDGTHSILELIELKNAVRHERLEAIRITDDTRSFIERKGYTALSILPKGEVLDLSAKTGRFFGGYTREMLQEIHPKFHQIFAKAGELVRAPVVGFDLITTDPSADPDTIRWGIIECNSLPFIDLHYYALEGSPNDLAPKVWDLWEKHR
jgi:D-alanine-D-alanine ligase-like ATP-grasp enzyme